MTQIALMNSRICIMRMSWVLVVPNTIIWNLPSEIVLLVALLVRMYF